MKSSRFIYTPMFLLLLCGLILGLSLAKPDDVSHAEWIGVTSSPNVEQCSLIQEKGEISFIVQKNGSWQGLQVTKQATPLKKQEIEFNGNSLAELGKFLNESPCRISHFSGTMVLELRGHVRAGETFDLTLPSQSGTGYLWEVEDLDQNGVILIGQPQMRQVSPHIGGIAAQIIPFRALLSNEVTLRLRYHRPWEVDNPVDFTFLIQGDQISLAELAQHISYSIPNTILENPNIGQATSVQGTPTPEQIIVMQDLPAAFNWCALGKCTPVRDQRNCGSCWAFATTGVLESKLLIAEKGSQDLSEQYLLSCNTNGWDCQGGWFAHDYHIWKTPPSETEAGAVLESAFPYQATMVPCNGPYAHPYRALSWSYVNRYVEIPSVAEIKQAIYTYGPVAAAVCAGPAFSSYRSGIFSTDEKSSCGSNMVDHGVVLVGWDDAQGVWILRNSWGPYWGEGGYMRIKYGISNVGFGANYLVYNTSPSPTTPAPTTPPSTTPPSTCLLYTS
ncbi:MAG: protease inhibitor I42 family protein, partial [Anaerolineales bacterium]|nr:protease inhibitor I42 family protein [Anaerolineales bacterium]